MTRTTRITTLDLDTDRLATDLARAERFGYNDSYGEFICGSWRSCMLWNRTGDVDDRFLEDYAGPARSTEYGAALPYLTELMERHFLLEHLKFARIARLTPGSVLVPHRDYLELDADLTRIHLPLRTDELCSSSEDETIYRMRRGELWFLDATRAHSAASRSDRDRVHLILDFSTATPAEALRPGLPVSTGIPEDSLVARRPLRPGEYKHFEALADVIDETNYQDVLALVIKRYFEAELKAADVFRWLEGITRASGRPELVAQAARHEEHCLVSR
ncbi:aspartyl/asparaginyl beta-hydroxylase domain-containing protein [Streptomyces sp. NPDC056503]|uniref:aspartyl/asparaginyl beta-hydroxylase domain-containing protein n=1 Tax=Streptomyces sp. NPDC056503 TaxID=3345842 RepID=UPI003691DC62